MSTGAVTVGDKNPLAGAWRNCFYAIVLQAPARPQPPAIKIPLPAAAVITI